MAIHPPTGWTADVEDGLIELTSPDRSVKLVVTAPAGGDEIHAVLAEAKAAIGQTYKDVEESAEAARELAGKKVAGLPSESAVLSATSDGGTALRIVLSAASGGARTYLVEVFSAVDAPTERITEAQLALGTLELSG